MATIFDMELNDVEIDNANVHNTNNTCISNDRQVIDYDEFEEEEDEPIVVDNEIEVKKNREFLF